MKTVHQVSSWILVVLGTGHTALTPLFYPGFTEDALWFAGTGLALLFLGLFNLAMLRMPLIPRHCLIANLIGSLYVTLLILTLPGPAPQAFLALLAFLGATAGSAQRSSLEGAR